MVVGTAPGAVKVATAQSQGINMVAMEGLKWSENCALVDVAFGVKKIVCTAVIPLNLSMDAIIEEMTDEDEGTFRNEIQSMSMTSMSLL